MALTRLIGWIRKRSPFVFFGCLTLAVLSVPLYRPAYIAIYKWREPHFIPPVSLDNGKLVLRNDGWGDGHFEAKRKGGRRHKGLDIKADMGSPVYASKSGRAVCGNVPGGMGKYVKIAHPDGFQTVYGHLKGWNIESDTRVRQGAIIGFVGKTGNANVAGMQPHVHFEIREGKRSVDPTERIRNKR